MVDMIHWIYALKAKTLHEEERPTLSLLTSFFVNQQSAPWLAVEMHTTVL